MATRVLIADGHQIVRRGLRALLEDQPDIEIVGEADDGRSAVRLARDLEPDVVVIEVVLSELNGVDATRQITSSTTSRVLALSGNTATRFVTRMFDAGASAYLTKDCSLEELVRAIRAASSRSLYVAPELAGTVVHEYVQNASTSASANGDLTPRQREVLQLIAEGESTREIAETLHVSVKTIETHRRQIMTRLNVASVAELTKYAVREGFTSLER